MSTGNVIGGSNPVEFEDVRVQIGSAQAQGSSASLTNLLDGALTWDQVKAEYESIEIAWSAEDAGNLNRKNDKFDISQINNGDEYWLYANSTFTFAIQVGDTAVAGGPISVIANGGFGSFGIDAVYGLKPQKTIITDDADYSTTEQQTNRNWIDGKPIYERVWTFNPGTTADETIIVTAAETALMDTIIEKIEHAQSGSGIGYPNSGTEGGAAASTVNIASSGGNWSWRTYGSSVGDIHFTKNGYSNTDPNSHAHIILRYTKA